MMNGNPIIEKSIKKLKQQPVVLFLVAQSKRFLSYEVIKNQLRKKIRSNVILLTAIDKQLRRKHMVINLYKKYQQNHLPR